VGLKVLGQLGCVPEGFGLGLEGLALAFLDVPADQVGVVPGTLPVPGVAPLVRFEHQYRAKS
jgi:hypothetical protein